MSVKLNYKKWDLEIDDLSLSSRKASEAIEARTGDKVGFVQINNERHRRGLNVSDSRAAPSNVTPPLSPSCESEPLSDISGQIIIPGVEAASASASTPNKEQIRSTLAGVEAVAKPQEVETARSIVGGLMDLNAVAVALGTTKRTILVYVREGRLKAVKIGAVWKVSPDNLKKFIDGQ